MPTWVQSGGLEEWIKRLKDPATRERVIKEMRTPSNDWENLLLLAGSPERVLLIAFKNPKLKPLTGKTLAEVAKIRGKSPEETAMDLVIEDDSRVGTVYFLMSEDNIKREAALPWMGLGSDEASEVPEGVFLKSSSHPRAYGNVARFLGKYVRDEKATTLQDAVRRLTSQPATNLGIRNRGWLAPGYYGDVRKTQAARHRRRRCVRQRRPGAERRQAHRRKTGALCPRPRLDRLARRRRVQRLIRHSGESGNPAEQAKCTMTCRQQ
jgi:N-acyl-D-amino-acid deacylase